METKKILKVVLVEPAGEINVGSVARLCENFRVNELRLVSPRCDYLTQEATKELSDKKIINQIIRGLTPPMPSFEIEPQSMADLLAYMHSLN